MAKLKTAYSQRFREHWELPAIETDGLHNNWADVLILLIENGPVDDGDIPSKTARDDLIEKGFAAKVIIDQKEAGNVATYRGRSLYSQLMDASCLKEALAKRKANPDFVNELWKSQRAKPEECGACGYTADPDCKPCSS